MILKNNSTFKLSLLGLAILTLVAVPAEINAEENRLSSVSISTGSSTSVVISPAPPAIRRPCNMFARKSCFCPMSFKPLCGSDGVTYANHCQFLCSQKCEPGLNFEKCGACWQTSTSSRACLPA